MFTHSISFLVLSWFISLCSGGPIFVQPASTEPASISSASTVSVSVLSASSTTAPTSASSPSTAPPYESSTSTPSVYITPTSTASAWGPPVSTVNCLDQTCNSRLWNETGPDILDVRQVHQNDCWWKAVQVSVTHHAKDRIMNFFFDPITKQSYADKAGDALLAPNPIVQLYNPFTYQPEYFDANILDRDLYDDKGPLLGVFWPDAMTQAMRKLSARYGLHGYNSSTNELDEGLEGYGPKLDTTLSILTGKPAWENNFSDFNSSDALYAYLEQSIYTPMMFTSVDVANLTVTDPPIKEDHVYPIISTYYNATTNIKMVHTRNVWGRTDNFTMADVWRNGLTFVHLQNYDRLT